MQEIAGLHRKFVRAAMAAPFLSREEEHDLARRWREAGDEKALHSLARAHMRLVMAIAAKFRHYGLPIADLVQEGHVGLLEAAARFDAGRDVRFSTYATWWIRAAVQDYVLRNWSIVRGGTSAAQKALFFNLRRLRARLEQKGQGLGSDQMQSAIAALLGVEKEDVAAMDARFSGADLSLSAPLMDADSPEGADRLDYLVDAAPQPDEVVAETIDSQRRQAWVTDALAVLDERELRIIRARQLAEEQATLDSLGQSLGISKERVRQIENRALEKLKKALLAARPAFGTVFG